MLKSPEIRNPKSDILLNGAAQWLKSRRAGASPWTATGLAEPVFLPGARSVTADPASEWRHYGGDAGASRYSPLDQINASNVKRLKVAWAHHTEDSSERPATTIECEPIVVDAVMYIQTAQHPSHVLINASHGFTTGTRAIVQKPAF